MPRRDEGLPPPGRGGRMGPEMAAEDPSIYGKLSSLAEREGVGGMGGGGDQQSADMLMQGANQLMQAARMNPALQPFVMQAIQILQRGVQGLAGGGETPPGMGGEAGAGGGRPRPQRRMKPPQSESGAGMDQFGV